jgi:hypothetical protein
VRYHDALVRNRTGSIVVSGPPASVTLTAAAQSITYGDSTTLSGAVSSKQASQSVVLNAQPFGEKNAKQANVTSTTTDGAFSFSVSPTIQTAYQAQWGKAASPTVTLYVRPRVGFGRSGRIYTVKVTSDIAYGGHSVYVQRRTSLGWRSVKKVFLSSSSRARFTMALPRGRSYLRVWLPASQAGAGYITSTSRILSVRR